MGYVERSLKPTRHTLHLGMGVVTEDHDIDSVGMDWRALVAGERVTFRSPCAPNQAGASLPREG